jgi:hypothetical protein
MTIPRAGRALGDLTPSLWRYSMAMPLKAGPIERNRDLSAD